MQLENGGEGLRHPVAKKERKKEKTKDNKNDVPDENDNQDSITTAVDSCRIINKAIETRESCG